ncbi:MAG: hypothetical protein QGD90_08925 [Candidatus Hydrogenedentes bacterium]|nr:hypothetical protein [Candidatus Hydrogenedentota bacterium]
MQLHGKAAIVTRGASRIGTELKRRLATKSGALSGLAEERLLIIPHKEVLA